MKSCIAFIFIVFLCLLYKPVTAQEEKKINDKLNTISYQSIVGAHPDFPADSVLKNYLKIELITAEEYEAKKQSKVYFLLVDTNKIRKRTNALRFPTAMAGTKVYKDKLTDGDDREEYEYLGQYPLFNSWLLRGMYWESMDYKFISKKDGSELASFPAMPLISPDKKMIVTISADPYEPDGGIDVYTIISAPKAGFKTKYSFRFPNWMPGDETGMFWSSDGHIYAPIQFTKDFWDASGNLNTQYLYVRISLF